MAQITRKKRELKGIGYELFIGALSILSIINLVLIVLFRYDPDLQTVLGVINAVMTPIFLGDFLYRLFTTTNKKAYFFSGFGWADLLSSLPFPQLKVLRFFRLWRVFRLFVEFGVTNLVHEFIVYRAENALYTVVFLVLCVLEFGSLAVLSIEGASPDANITTASDAIWWAYVTITTVGYGDQYPVTTNGRIIGVLVMTAGVGLFGTLSGFLANMFLAPPKKKEEKEAAETIGDDPKARMAEIRRLLDVQEATMADLRAKVNEVDQLL